MKKLYTLLVLAFTVFTANAQIVTIPDANFKAKLLEASQSNSIAKNLAGYSFKIDANNDGEIQVSEANQVSSLSVSNALIASLEGISSFANLYKLICSYNQLTTLNLTAQPNLSELRCEYNQINALTINTLSSLNTLYCNNNQLTTLNLSGCSALGVLICNDNLINVLTLPTSGPSLWHIDCKNNQLASLHLTNYNSLQNVICSNNLITTLTINSTHLQEVRCNNNQLTTIDTTNLLSLAILDCSFNLLTDLNISYNKVVNYLKCSNNQLETLNIKNGRTLTTQIISGNTGLKYICCDESRITSTLANTFQNSYPQGSVEVNSYCSFTPGGAFFTIAGLNRYDSTSTGCTALSETFPNFRVNISNGTVTAGLIANDTGNYNLAVQEGTYNLTAVIENPTYYNISPSTSSITFLANSTSAIQNFCITPNGNHQDLEVVLIPTSPARPGFWATYTLIYKNKGNITTSGYVYLNYSANQNVMTLNSATPNVSTNNNGTLTWDYTDLQPFETRTILLKMQLNTPTQTPALNAGDDLGLAAIIYPIADDEYYQDNHSQLKQKVVNSYDPNDKTCLEGTTITPSMVGEYVHYVIRFENTGTFPAQNVVVTDIIDVTKFDLATLIPLHGSHLFETRINNTTNKIEFIFQNINLPFDDANNDGYVAFKIKTKATLVLGDTFDNTANIYFDYNFPIVTNTASTTVATLSSQGFDFGTYFTIYPTPAKEVLNININAQIGVKSIAIYNTLGQLILAYTNAENLSTLDVNKLKSGTYFIKVTTDKGTASQQFVKE